jgi:hypothetical protein
VSALHQAFESRDVPAFCRLARELLASTPTDAEIDAIDAMTRAMLAYQATYAAR